MTPKVVHELDKRLNSVRKAVLLESIEKFGSPEKYGMYSTKNFEFKWRGWLFWDLRLFWIKPTLYCPFKIAKTTCSKSSWSSYFGLNARVSVAIDKMKHLFLWIARSRSNEKTKKELLTLFLRTVHGFLQSKGQVGEQNLNICKYHVWKSYLCTKDHQFYYYSIFSHKISSFVYLTKLPGQYWSRLWLLGFLFINF